MRLRGRTNIRKENEARREQRGVNFEMRTAVYQHTASGSSAQSKSTEHPSEGVLAEERVKSLEDVKEGKSGVRLLLKSEGVYGTWHEHIEHQHQRHLGRSKGKVALGLTCIFFLMTVSQLSWYWYMEGFYEHQLTEHNLIEKSQQRYLKPKGSAYRELTVS